MRKSTVEQDMPQMTIWRMRIARRIPNATNTNSEYVILDFALQPRLQEQAAMLRYTYIITEMECLLRGTNLVFKCN